MYIIMLHYQDLNMKLPMKNIISSNEIKIIILSLNI